MTKDQIYFEAEYYIRDKLKAPASADFSNYFSDRHTGVKMLATNTWEIFGWVDAVNSFGAKLRSSWRLIMVTHDDDDRYDVVYYQIGDEEVGDLNIVKAMLNIMEHPELINTKNSDESTPH